MKTTRFILFFLIAFIFSSCSMHFSGFSSQKYTHFKKKEICGEHAVNDRENSHFLQTESAKTDFVMQIRDEDDPKTARVKTAIQQKETIILAKDTNYFELVDPTYDQFYQQLHGNLTTIHRDSIPSKSLLLHSEKALQSGSFVQNIEELHYSNSNQNHTEVTQLKDTAQDSKNIFNRTRLKERRKWPEVTKEEEKSSKSAKRTKLFFGASVGAFALAVFALVILLLSWSAVFGFAAVSLLVLSQIFSLTAFVFAQKYRVEMRDKKKRRRKGIRLITGILFLSFYYLLMLFIGFIISLF